MGAPWLSVITIVKDDADGFARTVASLLAQERTDLEFLVIDSSTDASVIPALAEPAAGRVLWTEPRGIYAAMNMGLAHAQGRLAYFLNAGDELASADVLARVRAAIGSAVWGFGDVAIVDAAGHRVVPPPMNYAAEARASFARGRFPGHQGTFATTDALRAAGGFDETYAIAADYAMFLRLARTADPVQLPFVIATFYEGGASTQQWQASFREFHRARRTILAPRGLAGVRERLETVRHFAAVGAYRGIVAPLRGRT